MVSLSQRSTASTGAAEIHDGLKVMSASPHVTLCSLSHVVCGNPCRRAVNIQIRVDSVEERRGSSCTTVLSTARPVHRIS